MRHVLEAQQFDEDLIYQLFELTSDLKKVMSEPRRHQMLGSRLAGHMLFNIFYEPSTRTRMSFAAAAQHLGMEVVTTENAREFSSAAKGETLEDTIRTMCEYYPDVIVIRHHEIGSAKLASQVSSVPIINAGDGKGQHPTQALLDLFTINEEIGRLDNMRVVIGGDLANGRTARSLAYLLSKFDGNSIAFVAPPQLQIGQDIKDHLDERKVEYMEAESLGNLLPQADVVYWTRVQKERLEGDQKPAKSFEIGVAEMNQLPSHAILMHPLPRVEEISVTIDADPRAAYFRQAGNGMFVRMALIEWCLELI